MSNDLIPGFSALGMRIPIDSQPRFGKLLESLVAAGTPYPTVSGKCIATSGPGYRVWSRIEGDDFDQVLESPDAPGMLAHIEAVAGRDHLRVWFHDATQPEAKGPLFPALLCSPMPWFSASDIPEDRPQPFALTVIAREAGFFPDEATLHAHPDLGKMASQSIIPVGLFASEGQEPRPILFVIGVVTSSVRQRNDLTDDEFVTLRVDSLGGSLTVALPPEAVPLDVQGWIIAVEGRASGTFPASLPEPEPDERASRPPIDPERTEAEIRRLVIDYFDGPAFNDYFHDIHLDGLSRFLCLGLAIFLKAARGVPRQRGKATPKLAETYRHAARHAPIVMARVVIANTQLLYQGKSSPALVVIAFGDGADEAMDHARKILSRIHSRPTTDDRERALAREIEDETYHFGKRRRLPEWLVGDVEAYAADLWVPAVAVTEGGLSGEWLPCLAEPGPNGLTAAIPLDLVKQALKRPSGPPPLPPRP